MLEVMVNGCYGKMGQIVCDLLQPDLQMKKNLLLKKLVKKFLFLNPQICLMIL